MSLPATLPPNVRSLEGSQPLSLEMLDVSRIKENPNNARKHSRKQLAALKASLARFGAICPVVVDEHDQLLCGHARISAARDLGLQRVPCVRVSHLTQQQKRAYMLADNKIAQLASWDESALWQELQFLIDCNLEFDFSAIGFSIPEVNYILDRAGKRTNRDKRGSKQPTALAVAKSNDVWRLGDHLLRCGPIHTDQVDAIIRRWQTETGLDAIDARNGEAFNARERNLHDTDQFREPQDD